MIPDWVQCCAFLLALLVVLILAIALMDARAKKERRTPYENES